jgi:hypothetical protein
MLTKRVKSVLKSAVRRTFRYAQSPKATPVERPNSGQEDFAYSWLNSLFTKILHESGGSLRPSYTWGVLQSVHLAKAIGIGHVSAIEFGVAGGNGLIELERIADKVEEIFGVGIDVYGFDTGTGLPKPQDYRDLPNLYTEQAFPMDIDKLKRRLTRAHLILGLVETTVPTFMDSAPAPVAFISFDLDYYSSTMQAFKLLEADHALLLPRIHCYFDDIMGFTFSDYTGERLAISEFNASHSMRKLSPIYCLRYYLPTPPERSHWPEKFYMAHIFDHDLYGRNDGSVRRPSGGFTDLRDK